MGLILTEVWLTSQPVNKIDYKIFSLNLPPKFFTDEQFVYVNNQVFYFISEQEIRWMGAHEHPKSS